MYGITTFNQHKEDKDNCDDDGDGKIIFGQYPFGWHRNTPCISVLVLYAWYVGFLPYYGAARALLILLFHGVTTRAGLTRWVAG